MDDEIGVIERGGEELLVALEPQGGRHDVIGISQHAVGGHNDVAFEAERWHDRGRPGRVYCVTSVTTLETGRWLKVGSLTSFNNASSYCGSDCTGALARIATTL